MQTKSKLGIIVKAGMASVALLMLAQFQFAYAEEDEYGIEHPTPPKHSGKVSKDEDAEREPEYTGTVTSMDALRVGIGDDSSTACTLAFMAEYHLKHGNPDRALKLAKMAVERDYQDIDSHKVYAECLERKWNKDTPKDPDIYNACVMEWLIILRQEVGWEKLSSSNGLSIPGLGKFYEDEDQVMPARQHLMSLTGVLPKVWENDNKYLKRVLKPSTAGVTGKVLPKAGTSADTKDGGAAVKSEDGKAKPKQADDGAKPETKAPAD